MDGTAKVIVLGVLAAMLAGCATLMIDGVLLERGVWAVDAAYGTTNLFLSAVPATLELSGADIVVTFPDRSRHPAPALSRRDDRRRPRARRPADPHPARCQHPRRGPPGPPRRALARLGRRAGRNQRRRQLPRAVRPYHAARLVRDARGAFAGEDRRAFRAREAWRRGRWGAPIWPPKRSERPG